MRNINLSKQTKTMLFIATFFFGIFTHTCHATPLNNVYDTQPIYSVFGADKFFKKRECGQVRFVISPLYQQTSTARDNAGKKVPAGDRLGKWNLFGVFFGQDAAPAPVNMTNFPNLFAAQTAVDAITSQAPTVNPPNQANRYRVGPAHPANPPTQPNEVQVGGLTNEFNFDPDKRPFAYVSVPLNYEKIGVRSQINFDFAFGLGCAVKGGVVDVKQAPKKFIYEAQFIADAGFASTPTPNTTPAPTDALGLYCAFMDPLILERITEELNFNMHTFHKTGAEDVHMQVYWHMPIDFKDSAGDLSVTMAPYLSLGLWLPTSKETNTDKAFAVPFGNNGFTCFTAEGSIAFDFPILPQRAVHPQTLQCAFGGGILLSSTHTKFDQRLPSSELQTGLIPWKAPFLRIHPGLDRKSVV